MVDTADLGLSGLYFTVIQILRISADWIQESMDDLRQTVDDMERLYLDSTIDGQFASFCPPGSQDRDAAAKVFRENWESVLSHQQRLGNALLLRVAKKMEETKSLRDGVSTTPHRAELLLTACRPAVQRNGCERGDQVDAVEPLHFGFHRGHRVLPAAEFYCGMKRPLHSILTTPLQFQLTSGKALFALGLFDWQDPRQTTWFIITTIMVAGVTYFVSWLSIWVVGNPARKKGVSEYRLLEGRKGDAHGKEGEA